MGTINYGKSQYITIGADPDNYERDGDLYWMQYDYDDAAELVKEVKGSYYHVSLEPGYYEGFYVDIEENYGACFDYCEDRAKANKEITQIKKLLHRLVNEYFLCAVLPGWCTTYYDAQTSHKMIDEAIKDMRADVKNKPTWMRYSGKRITAY